MGCRFLATAGWPSRAPGGKQVCRLSQSEPAFGEQPGGQDIAWPVDAKEDPARPDSGGCQQRDKEPGRTVHTGVTGTGPCGQGGKRGVLRRQAEALRFGHPDSGGWPRPRDRLREPAAYHRAAGHNQARRPGCPPAKPPRRYGCEDCQQGRDGCRFGQCAHRVGGADSGRVAAPGFQSPDRCLVKLPEPAVPRVGGDSGQGSGRHRAVEHVLARPAVAGSRRPPRLPASPGCGTSCACEHHHGPVPQHRGSGPIGHTAKLARAQEVARLRRDPPPMWLAPRPS